MEDGRRTAGIRVHETVLDVCCIKIAHDCFLALRYHSLWHWRKPSEGIAVSGFWWGMVSSQSGILAAYSRMGMS